MRLPRNLNGAVLAERLARLNYSKLRQRGSHLSLRTQLDGQFTIRIPMHKPIRPGTLEKILKDLADHHKLDPDQLLEKLGL
jgi:predicted RNA binding protein YcfA (HicA-like mRNA interferase family)